MIQSRFIEGRLVLRGCFPHYRRPVEEIIELRRAIFDQLTQQRVILPIKKKIQLTVLAHKHERTADLWNIVQAICQALDGRTLSIHKQDIILEDDSQIVKIVAEWINKI